MAKASQEQLFRDKLRKMERQEQSLRSGFCWKCKQMAEPIRLARAIAIGAVAITCCACAKRLSDRRLSARKAIAANARQSPYRYSCGLCSEAGHNAATCHNATYEQACAWHGLDD